MKHSTRKQPKLHFLALLGVLLLFTTTSCDQSHELPRDIDSISQTARELIGGDSDTVKLSVEEVKKLHQFEYRVIEIPLTASPEEMEERLNVFGKERWNCAAPKKRFSKEHGEAFLFVCKRNPETPLRFVPRTLLGR